MKKAKILVVEDNPMNMELASDLLLISGYQVLMATHAREGIEMAKIEMPDLVLMDIGLPDINGLEATAMLKKDQATHSIPIVALTAHAMNGDEEQARAAGCIGYITKPIDMQTFAPAVERFLNAAAVEQNTGSYS